MEDFRTEEGTSKMECNEQEKLTPADEPGRALEPRPTWCCPKAFDRHAQRLRKGIQARDAGQRPVLTKQWENPAPWHQERVSLPSIFLKL